MLLRRLVQLFTPDTPRPSRPKPSRLRPAGRLLFQPHDPVHCATCDMLLGAVALRRGVCPRCRATLPPPPAPARRR